MTLPDPADCPDVVVLGAGSGGEDLASALAGVGRRVTVVEALRVGGECPYVACVPSKALLLAARARRDARRAAQRGGVASELDLGDAAAAFGAAVHRRDLAAEGRDDAVAAGELTAAGVELVRGRGQLTGRSGPRITVEVEGRVLHAGAVVIATGSVPQRPPLEGLDSVDGLTWTSDACLSDDVLPHRLAVLGAGAVGCELAQVYAAFGSEVTVVDPAETVLAQEDPRVGRALGDALGASGVRLVLGRRVEQVSRRGEQVALRLDDGEELVADRLLLATGRRPASAGLGLATLGVRPQDDGRVAVDGHGAVLDPAGTPVAGLWGVGDITGVAPYTHTAKAQARSTARAILGQPGPATPTAIPRCVYTDPAVASVGLTAAQARDRGIAVREACVALDGTARGFLEQAGGVLLLVADAGGRLLGAAAVGPEADSWFSGLTLAVHLGLGVAELAEVVAPFPTWQEAVSDACRQLLETPTGPQPVAG